MADFLILVSGVAKMLNNDGESRDFDCFAFEQLSTLNALEDAIFTNARDVFGYDEGEYHHVNRT